MIEILQWSTLAICGAAAVARIPSAVRGENRSLFYIFVLATLAILLSIDGPYVAIDRLLGGTNVTNLILRFVIFAVILLVGYRIARGFGAPASIRLILGPIGLGILAVIATATLVLFLLADTEGSVAGLTTLPSRSPRNAQLIELYAAAGRLYPAYVAASLLPATLAAASSNLAASIRWGAGLLSVAFVALPAGTLYPLLPDELGPLKALINYLAVLSLMGGLLTIWIGRVRAQPPARRSSTAK
ncbi:hypothetical protein TV39_03700 [Arthrobacter sp. SPG23]|uniref:hypothetical protein n=1 Tax=Arthrobacter sp. SPG23 TaxID=1610703 RepID=UPI0005BE96E7|nr:hypothetical protein [Arthrobacter sp. SPG23]KIS28528.1 hypothetical protein TV39_03700 [Arthrobacter sp. SPG23]